ncbi:MAG TPA: HAMP domain-containing sensor histidine kinase [Ktedonobacteraceae bacterium]|nr:HAMP domain-containing sensor histidine kinase [Ktedonobacteraceae bacterium]
MINQFTPPGLTISKVRVHWWQSIRWRFALVSIMIALLATALLAVIMLVAINYYYGIDLRQRLTVIADTTAQRIGVSYAQNGSLPMAVNTVLPNSPSQNSQNSEYLLLIFDTTNRSPQLIYPRFGIARRGANFAALLLALTDPSVQKGDFTKIINAITNARNGIPTVDDIGTRSPGASPRPFVVQPIFNGGQSGAPVVGVLLVIPRSIADNTVPPFLMTIRIAILIVSAIIAFLAAIVAILFSRTITHPLAKLTSTARVLASGDYSARVTTQSKSELGELAITFNEMATRLEKDVDELRKQEFWRRELIMNITHDLATPLTAIAGLGESLVDGVNQDRDDYEVTGRIIVRETLRLRRLVQDLHLMAKVEAGAMQPQPKVLRLAAVVDEALAVLAPEFERANVEPLNNVAFHLPPAWADPDMLMRVFSNLCDNALRHSPAGGTVVIEARQLGNTLEVAVTDSGRGIPPEALARVFDRFYRADTSRQIRTGGSGLGLTIVRAIIEAHGGTIRAENAPQGGARFIFSLPIAEQAPVWSYTTTPIR